MLQRCGGGGLVVTSQMEGKYLRFSVTVYHSVGVGVGLDANLF